MTILLLKSDHLLDKWSRTSLQRTPLLESFWCKVASFQFKWRVPLTVLKYHWTPVTNWLLTEMNKDTPRVRCSLIKVKPFHKSMIKNISNTNSCWLTILFKSLYLMKLELFRKHRLSPRLSLQMLSISRILITLASPARLEEMFQPFPNQFITQTKHLRLQQDSAHISIQYQCRLFTLEPIRMEIWTYAQTTNILLTILKESIWVEQVLT